MILRTYLPDSITLPCGAVLKPVIGGHLGQKPFITKENTGIDVTVNGWGMMPEALRFHPDPERAEHAAVILEAKRRKLKFRRVAVLSRRLRGKLDLHGRQYGPSRWVYVEVKP